MRRDKVNKQWQIQPALKGLCEKHCLFIRKKKKFQPMTFSSCEGGFHIISVGDVTIAAENA